MGTGKIITVRITSDHTQRNNINRTRHKFRVGTCNNNPYVTCKGRYAPVDPKANGEYAEDAEITAAVEGIAGQIRRR